MKKLPAYTVMVLMIGFTLGVISTHLQDRFRDHSTPQGEPRKGTVTISIPSESGRKLQRLHVVDRPKTREGDLNLSPEDWWLDVEGKTYVTTPD